MKVLVTSDAGCIGSHTIVDLLNAGYEVIIVDDLSNAKANVIDRIETIIAKRPDFYQMDCANKDGLCYVFRTYDIDSVIHSSRL